MRISIHIHLRPLMDLGIIWYLLILFYGTPPIEQPFRVYSSRDIISSTLNQIWSGPTQTSKLEFADISSTLMYMSKLKLPDISYTSLYQVTQFFKDNRQRFSIPGRCNPQLAGRVRTADQTLRPWRNVAFFTGAEIWNQEILESWRLKLYTTHHYTSSFYIIWIFNLIYEHCILCVCIVLEQVT